jgi:hypothetical protein
LHILGDLPISTALEFTKYFAKESEAVSWNVFLRNMRMLFYFYTESQTENTTTATPTYESLQVRIGLATAGVEISTNERRMYRKQTTIVNLI